MSLNDPLRILHENPMPIEDAAKYFPHRPHISTVWRYVLKGYKGLKLESIMSGNRRITSREAVLRFIAATTARANGDARTRPLDQRRAAVRHADAKARALGA